VSFVYLVPCSRDLTMCTDRPILTLLSMLHEPAGDNSATRRFRDAPVLDWTLRRLAFAHAVAATASASASAPAASMAASVPATSTATSAPAALLCWDDQLAAVTPVAAAHDVAVLSRGPRSPLPHVDAVTAARRWADGWRSGPIGASAFDAGYHAAAVRDAVDRFDAAAVLLIDPAAGLVDPGLVAAVVRRWRDDPALEYTFTPAATGLGAMLLAKPLVDRLAAAGAHPGKLLAYFPDQLSREPTSGDGCAPAPTPAARSLHRFTLSSRRQVDKLSAATADLNGHLSATGAEALAVRLNVLDPVDALPREVVLELTTRRLTRPIFSPLAPRPDGSPAAPIDRPDLPFDLAVALIDDLAALDDARLTLAGVGDPLLHPRLADVIAHAAARGVAVNVETDLLTAGDGAKDGADDGRGGSAVDALAASAADVVSVHLPALTEATYAAVMGVDAYRRALENVRRFVAARAAAGRGTPLVVPLFAKCAVNQHEMESWYDQWLRAVGSAVVVGPTTFGGLIPDAAAADMTPPRRVPCRRLAERLTVLSDGRYTTCEQDVLGRQALGRVGTDALSHVWQGKFAALRNAHRDGRWKGMTVCDRCREWHRR
jgi:pyruvate-formate lyase-activating enzyme